MDGILLFDKPKGPTSFDVVHKVRKTVESAGLNTTGKKRFPVGHTGTLDPLASGLLILVLGSYTKRAQEFSKMDKTYEVTMKLGQTSSTGDEEGDKAEVNSKKPTEEEIRAALSSFQGEVEQTPPAHSAVKVGGKRAYKLARAGKEVKIEPRKVKIYEISYISYQYPYVKFVSEVSSGTFIRSLVEDIGSKLGTGAYTADLRRLSVGGYSIKQAISSDNLNAEDIKDNLIKLA